MCNGCTVVNRRKEEFDIYIGRGSRWGNPYKIGPDGDRQEVIRKYEYDFRAAIRRGEIVRKDLEALRGKRLGCYCKPYDCHGDVIARAVNNPEEFGL